MLARQLDYAPTADELPFTVQVMTDDLVRRGLRDVDVPRLHEAFAKLGPMLQRWPTARAVIEALPAKPQPPLLSHQSSVPRIMPKIRVGSPGRRSKFLPGESLNDFMTALIRSGKTTAAFDAERLIKNGWTSELEINFQYHAAICKMYISDDELISELSCIETNDEEARLEREAIMSED